jgi:hypothetical protein
VAESGCDPSLRAGVVCRLNHRDLFQQAIGFGEGTDASFPVLEALLQHPGRFEAKQDVE